MQSGCLICISSQENPKDDEQKGDNDAENEVSLVGMGKDNGSPVKCGESAKVHGPTGIMYACYRPVRVEFGGELDSRVW